MSSPTTRLSSPSPSKRSIGTSNCASEQNPRSTRTLQGLIQPMHQLNVLQPTNQLHQLNILQPARTRHQLNALQPTDGRVCSSYTTQPKDQLHQLNVLQPARTPRCFVRRPHHLGGPPPLSPKPYQFLHRFRHLGGTPSPRLNAHRPPRPGRCLEPFLGLSPKPYQSLHLGSAVSRPPMAARSALPV